MNLSQFPQIYHIGCMKTGTTSLQEIWKKDPRINLILHSRYFNTEAFDSSLDYIEKYECGQGKIDFESDENISRKIKQMQGLELSLKRIHSLAPKAKIVFTVRHPKDMLISMYKHVIRQTDKSYTIPQFINSPEGKSFLETIKYGESMAEVLQYFKRDQIYVFKQEDYKSDREAFLRRFYDEVFGIPFDSQYFSENKNIGRNDQQIFWKRKVNAWKKSGEGSLAGIWNRFLSSVVLRVAYRWTKNNTKKRYTWDSFRNIDGLEKELSVSMTRYEKLMNESLNYHF